MKAKIAAAIIITAPTATPTPMPAFAPAVSSEEDDGGEEEEEEEEETGEDVVDGDMGALMVGELVGGVVVVLESYGREINWFGGGPGNVSLLGALQLTFNDAKQHAHWLVLFLYVTCWFSRSAEAKKQRTSH